MKKKFIKALALMLSLVFAFGALSCSNDSCSKDKNPDKDIEDNEGKEKFNSFEYYSNTDLTKYVELDPESIKNIEVELSNYYQVTDEAFEKNILQERFKYKEALDEGKEYTEEPVEWGDTAYIFFTGFVDGVEFDGGSNMDEVEPYPLDVGSKTFILGFEDNLIGLKPCDSSRETPLEFCVTFPENYGNDALKGKEVVFKVVITKTVKNRIPELDEDLIKNKIKYTQTGDGDIVEEYKEFMRNAMEETALYYAGPEIDTKMWLKVIENNNFKSLPEDRVNEAYNELVERLTYSYEYYKQQSLSSPSMKKYESIDEYAKDQMTLGDGEKWQDKVMEDARTSVKQAVIMYSIAKANNVTVSKAELDAEAALLAAEQTTSYFQVTPAQIIEMYGEDAIKENALRNKVVDLISKTMTVKYV